MIRKIEVKKIRKKGGVKFFLVRPPAEPNGAGRSRPPRGGWSPTLKKSLGWGRWEDKRINT